MNRWKVIGLSSKATRKLFQLLTSQNAWSLKQFLSCGGFQKFHLTSSPFHNNINNSMIRKIEYM